MPGEPSSAWQEILGEAINLGPIPVLGTHFRGLVDSVLSTKETSRPDDGGLRFIQLLERFPDIVSVQRRPGQDFLVVPTAKREILATQLQRRSFGIRHDLFQAFTMVSANRPYYDKTSGQIVWQTAEQTAPSSFVPISPTDLGAEIKLRRDFAEQIGEPCRSQLLKTFDDPLPLRAFGNKIREEGLQSKWHSFRTERVLEKMQLWASENMIDWKDSWLTTGPETRPDSLQGDPALYTRKGSAAASGSQLAPLQLLLAKLDAADVQRIAVPLDLVLKALS